jgi:carbonic anhydrase
MHNNREPFLPENYADSAILMGLRDSLKRLPKTLFITCEDARVVPAEVARCDPGNLLVIRNPGNCVPQFGSADLGEGAALELAVMAVEVKTIIICGHSDCKMIKVLLSNGGGPPNSTFSVWLQHAAKTRRAFSDSDQFLSEEALFDLASKHNTSCQADNLETYPFVAKRLMRGDLTIKTWFYRLEDKQVFSLERGAQRFVAIDDMEYLPFGS